MYVYVWGKEAELVERKGFSLECKICNIFNVECIILKFMFSPSLLILVGAFCFPSLTVERGIFFVTIL